MKRLALFIAIVFAFGLFGCAEPYMTSAGQVVADEDGNTLALTVMPDNIDISAEGSVSVMVETYDFDGEPIEGADIALSSTLGTLESTSVTTDASGTGTTTLAAGDVPGWGVVVATYQGKMAEAPISFYDGSTGTDATF